MSTNLEYRERERQRKRESRQRASETQREKERQGARAGDKEHLLEEQHENFVAAVKKRELLAVTNVKMSGIEKKSEQEQIRHFLHKTCN